MTASKYQIYLASLHWKQLRKWTLKERGGACEECGISNIWAVIGYGQPLNVHHIKYERLGHERPEDVQVLCRRDHELKHFGSTTLPDLSALYWKICVGIKEFPDELWSLLKAIEQLPIVTTKQLSLPLTA